MRRVVLPVPMLVAALVVAGPAASKPPTTPQVDAGSPQAGTLLERATSELVLIEVYVTDSEGRAIRDLTVDDLSLLVDGHVRPIHSLELREVPGTATAPRSEPPVAGPRPEVESASSRLPRRFVLFFEDGMSSPSGLTEARRQGKRFLESGLLPSDQVALASYDRRLRILHDFSTDREALTRVLDASLEEARRFTDYAAEQLHYETEIEDAMAHARQGGQMNPAAGSAQLRLLANNYANEYTPRARDVLRALTTVVDSLAPYPGYKGLVFMGDGVPENPAVDFLQRFAGTRAEVLTSEVEKFDLSLEIKMLAHYASAAGVTLHSVQTAGVSSTTPTSLRDAGRRTNALETLALNTGGTKSSSNDFFKALTEAEASSRAYYVLGYVPEGPPDGKYHSVQVRLKHRSGNVRSRRGFMRLTPDQARQRAVQAAYVLPEFYSDLGMEMTAVPGPFDGTARIYDLVLHLPPGRAVFVPRPGGLISTLEAGFVLLDDARHEILRVARLARVTLPSIDMSNSIGIDFYSRIRVPLSGHVVTAVVNDLSNGTVGAARMAIPPAGDPGAAGAVGLSIYSLKEQSLWVEIPPTAAPGPSEGAPTAYEIGPSLKRTFSVGEPLACGFRLAGADAGVRLTIRKSGVEVKSVAVESPGPGGGPTPGPGSIKVNLPVEDLSPGDYEVVVRRKTTGGVEADAGMTTLRLLATPGPESVSGS